MSDYTTGEAAKRCGVTVRTVQYYDKRGIAVPSALTEGGRRVYSEDDLRRLRIVCFLRETGMRIDAIARLFTEPDAGDVIGLLLQEQAKTLRSEINDGRQKLDRLETLRRELRTLPDVTVESIADIAAVMENKSNLKKLHRTMLLTGIPVTALQWAGIVLWITKGWWWLFALWAAVALPWGILISRRYFHRVAYICPHCHTQFQPTIREAFFASHTPKTRRLTCPECGRRGSCVETYCAPKP